MRTLKVCRLAYGAICALLLLSSLNGASVFLAATIAHASAIKEQTLNWDDAFDRSARGTSVAEGEGIRPMLGVDSERALLEAIARYEIFVRRGGWPKVPGGHAMVVGSNDRRVQLLTHRLMISGDLVPPPGFDDTLYDGTVLEAVKKFQERHGLLRTGKVDERTRIALNVSAAERLKTLRANLPRIRQAARGLRGRYVVVNVPAAELETVQDGSIYSRHVIIVGKVDRPTPEVASHITELNFNPYWHAPISIAEKDIIPQLQRGVSYLKKINIKVFEGSYYGKEVDPKTIDWSTASAKKYFFRQEPGKNNAMASVRIKFPNEHDVYLHDTPGKGRFMQAVRYDSSGCIRVDQVETFAAWLLREQSGWSTERVEEMEESRERVDVNLSRKIPVRLVYLTAWATSDGLINFRKDIYGRDDPTVIKVAKTEVKVEPRKRERRTAKSKYPLPKPNPYRVKHQTQSTRSFGSEAFEDVR